MNFFLAIKVNLANNVYKEHFVAVAKICFENSKVDGPTALYNPAEKDR